jgi:hypothetical protein
VADGTGLSTAGFASFDEGRGLQPRPVTRPIPDLPRRGSWGIMGPVCLGVGGAPGVTRLKPYASE